MTTYRSKINSFKSVLIKGAYIIGIKPKNIARKFNVSLASVYRHIKWWFGRVGLSWGTKGLKVFYGRGNLPHLIMPFPFHHNSPTRSPKKLSPEERLRRYVEQKYGKLNVQKKDKIVEKKS